MILFPGDASLMEILPVLLVVGSLIISHRKRLIVTKETPGYRAGGFLAPSCPHTAKGQVNS